jgi:peroxiredoxin 5
MKAWSESLDPNKSSNIRFLGDPSGAFTKAFDTGFDSAKIFGQDRSKRYAVTIENGKVKEVFIEPDNTGVNGESIEIPSVAPLRCSSSGHSSHLTCTDKFLSNSLRG